jgi:hypothetical protein
MTSTIHDGKIASGEKKEILGKKQVLSKHW